MVHVLALAGPVTSAVGGHARAALAEQRADDRWTSISSRRRCRTLIVWIGDLDDPERLVEDRRELGSCH